MWTESAIAMEWEQIAPETHPGNYILAVAYYAVWLVVQALLALIGAIASCCCLRKKKMAEQPTPVAMWGARAVLGLCMVGTIVMANSMELFGNRDLNDSIHNAIHSIEGLTNYGDDWIQVGHDSVDVLDAVYTQLGVLNRTIFDSANPIELQAAASCMQAIGSGCPDPPRSNEDLVDDYFEWAGHGEGPTGTPPDPANSIQGTITSGNCDISLYTEDTGDGTRDYVRGTTLEALNHTILDQVDDFDIGRCAIYCLIGQPSCTGAQWTMEDGPNGQAEANCVLWLNDKCSTGSSAPGYTPGADAEYTPGASQHINVVYKRVVTSLPANETECVQDKTVTIVNNIHDNVISLPTELTDIVDTLDTMMVNRVSLCFSEINLAARIGDGLAELVPLLEDLQTTLGDFMGTVREMIQDLRRTLAQADDGWEELKAPPPPGHWGVSITEAGDPYPNDPPTPPECSGGTSCSLNADQTDCSETAGVDCIYKEEQPSRPRQCMALACMDNQFDYYDENRGNTLPMARTQVFSTVSMAAMFGSFLGLLALVTNKVIVWKLMCFIFFLWAPASLILSAAVHPPMIGASDLCQDVEELAMDIAEVQNPEWTAAGPVELMKGDDIMEMVSEMGFNYTGAPIEDVEISDMRALMSYYLLDNCQGEGDAVDRTLTTLQTLMTDVVVSLAGSAGDMVEDLTSEMGDSGMQIRPAVVDEMVEVTTIVSDRMPGVIHSAFNMVKCPRLSKAYYEVKAPICCDVVVSMYWIACTSFLLPATC